MKPRVVITGAGGFIGTHLRQSLALAGYAITGLTRRKSGASSGLKIVADYGDAPQADILIHLGEASHVQTVNSAGELYLSQQIATAKALRGKYDHIIYLSSSLVYQKSTQNLSESAPTSDETWYAKVKLAVESVFLEPSEHTTILRLSNIYGDRIKGETLFSDIYGQRNKPVMKLRSLDSFRDYLHIEDLARLILRVLQIGKGAMGTFNIGFGTSYSSEDIARCFCDVLEINLPIEGKHNAPDSVMLDIAKARNQFDWLPLTPLIPEGVKRMCAGEGRV